MYKTRLNTLTAAMGLISTITTAPVMADVNYYDWDGLFTMLTEQGDTLQNADISVAKDANRHQTPISGTLAFDDNTGAGSATMGDFSWFNGTLPWGAEGIKLQAIGDGTGGAGTLIFANMLFSWDGNTGMPASIVLDAAGLFNGSVNGDFDDGVLDQADVAAYGAIPASDGTYVGVSVPGTDAGYLSIGPLPIATTEWDTSNINGCVFNNCDGNSSSGGLPLITDTAANENELLSSLPDKGDGVGIGGSPMQDGPFVLKNINLDFTELRRTSFDIYSSIEQNCAFDPNSSCQVVPVPAAVWLFGSGLLGLIALAGRKSSGF